MKVKCGIFLKGLVLAILLKPRVLCMQKLCSTMYIKAMLECLKIQNVCCACKELGRIRQ